LTNNLLPGQKDMFVISSMSHCSEVFLSESPQPTNCWD